MSVDHGLRQSPTRERIFDLLADLDWHHWRELARICNRYTARLLELRRLGYGIDSAETLDGNGKFYRLVSLEASKAQRKRVKVLLEESDAECAAVGIVTAPAQLAIAAALDRFRANRGKL